MIRLRKELGHGKQNSQNEKYRAESMERQRGQEVTKVRNQKSEAEGTEGGGKVPEQKAADEKGDEWSGGQL